MVRRSLLLALTALIAAAPAAGLQDEFKDDVRKLLNDGIEFYKQGKLAEAYGKFEEAFQKQPDSDLVYAFIQRAGQDLVASMMSSSDERIKSAGYRLFELAKPGEMVRKSKKSVLKYIEDLKSEDHAVVRNAHWHLKNFGPWALRFVLPALDNAQQDVYRSRVLLLLAEMGTDATLGVIECLENKESIAMRQNAAIALGNIKDDRAIPALKRVAESATEPPEVKKFAEEALAKITRKPYEELRPAAEYYFDLAERYYLNHSSVIHAWNRSWIVWHWDDAKKVVTEREVPRFSWNEQLAEETLYDLLKMDPDYHHPTRGSAWSLLACVHLAQAVEAAGGIEAAELAQASGDPGLLPDHIEVLKRMLSGAEGHRVLGSIPGRAYLYEALSRSLKEGNGAVARAAIEVIKRMGREDDLPAGDGGEGGDDLDAELEGGDGTIGFPLVEALAGDDKRVRYAAAEAMVLLNPRGPKLGNELVIPNLVDALGEQGVRVALVIYDVQDEADRSFVNSMRSVLTKVGVHPIFASSGDEGILKARQFPTEDLFIVQHKIAGQVYFKETETRQPVVETVFDTLRQDIRTRHVPRLILADGAGERDKAKEQFDQTAQGFLTREEILAVGGHLVLQGLFERLFDTAEAKKSSKDLANRIAQSAAEALASIDVSTTVFPFRDAVDPLIRTVSPEVLREEAIRLPAVRALGRFGDQRALEVLSKVLADKATDAQKPIRQASAIAMGQIFKATGATPIPEIFDVLKTSVVDGDLDIERAVGEAIGNAVLTPLQRLELAERRRIARDAKTPDDE